MKAVSPPSTEKCTSTNRKKAFHKKAQERRVKGLVLKATSSGQSIFWSSELRVKGGGPEGNGFLTDLLTEDFKNSSGFLQTWE